MPDECTPLTSAPSSANAAADIYGDEVVGGGAEEDLAGTITIYLTAITAASVRWEEFASQYFLKDTMGLGPAAMSATLSFSSFGSIVKPVWGMITDSLPIRGQRRRPYVMIVSTICALAFLSYGGVETLAAFIATLMISNCCMAFLTTIAQALIVQRSAGGNIKGASLNISSYSVMKKLAEGVFVLSAGFMLNRFSPRSVLMAPSMCFALLFCVACFMFEASSATVLHPVDQIATVVAAFRRREVFGIALYFFAMCVRPSPRSALFFFNVDVLMFGPEFIAVLVCITSAASICGITVYHKFLTEVPFRKLFFVATLLRTVVSLGPLIQIFRLNLKWGISDHVFTVVDTFVNFAVLEVLWTPVLVLASRLCPPSACGAMYAVFFSVHHLGVSGSKASGAALTHALGITRDDLRNLWSLVALCALTSLAPLAFLPLVPRADPDLMRNAEGSSSQALP